MQTQLVSCINDILVNIICFNSNIEIVCLSEAYKVCL